MEQEKIGNAPAAIEMYEKAVKMGFDGSRPYDRLCVFYRKQKLYDNEIRIAKAYIKRNRFINIKHK